MKSVVVSCENKEELDSILNVLCSISPELKVYIFNTMSLYSDRPFFCSRNVEVIECKRLFSGNFKLLSVWRKLLESLYVLIQLLLVCRRVGSTCLVVGVSLVYHRLLKIVMGRNIFLVSFVRSTIVYRGEGRVRGFFRRLRLIGSIADSYYCMGSITAKYLSKQSKGRVHVVGPFDADRYPIDSVSKTSRDVTCLVLISSAFSWHGDHVGQAMQVEYFKSLACSSRNTITKVIVLVHPRDDASLYSSIQDVEIASGGLARCVEIHNDLNGQVQFVSMVSTLSFELAYLGINSVIASPREFYELNSDWYSSLGVLPVMGRVESDLKLSSKDVDPILFVGNRGKVIEVAASKFFEELKKNAQ